MIIICMTQLQNSRGNEKKKIQHVLGRVHIPIQSDYDGTEDVRRNCEKSPSSGHIVILTDSAEEGQLCNTSVESWTSSALAPVSNKQT